MTPHNKPAAQGRTHTITVIDDSPNLLDQMLEQHETKPRPVLGVDVATTPSKTVSVLLDELQRPTPKPATTAVKQVADAMADLHDIFPPSKWDSLETIFADKTRRLVVCSWCGDPKCSYSHYV